MPGTQNNQMPARGAAPAQKSARAPNTTKHSSSLAMTKAQAVPAAPELTTRPITH